MEYRELCTMSYFLANELRGTRSLNNKVVIWASWFIAEENSAEKTQGSRRGGQDKALAIWASWFIAKDNFASH